MEIDVKYGNELYIKMNARGKQLTPFENFKADLLGYLKNEKVNWVNDIANGLDETWQNKFFNLWKKDFIYFSRNFSIISLLIITF